MQKVIDGGAKKGVAKGTKAKIKERRAPGSREQVAGLNFGKHSARIFGDAKGAERELLGDGLIDRLDVGGPSSPSHSSYPGLPSRAEEIGFLVPGRWL
uniref:Uncharacterized protein n=1 Tax=Steinernema glaseri TaxID=37863 RepID=A0A1I7Z362_9BILA